MRAIKMIVIYSCYSRLAYHDNQTYAEKIAPLTHEKRACLQLDVASIIGFMSEFE